MTMDDTIGFMRLFVRVDGITPFTLMLPDNLVYSNYVEIATKYFKEMRSNARENRELTLIRRIHFNNNDILLDFKRKMSTSEKSVLALNSTTVSHVNRERVPDILSESLVDMRPLYTSINPMKLRSEFLVTETLPTVPACETQNMIVNISFNRLITLITSVNCSPFNEDVFWVTYRQFATPKDVLKKLIERYNTPRLTNVGEAQKDVFDQCIYEEMATSVKTKVFNVLENWVTRCFFDFSDDTLYRHLNDFVREKIDTDCAPPRILTLMRDGIRASLHLRQPLTMPGTVNRTMTTSALIAQYLPREIADQLTILTQLVHSRIHPYELIGGLWEGPRACHVPNCVSYRDFFSRVSNWVTYSIVSETDSFRRTANWAAILSICDELMKLKNFDMAMAMYGGLMEPPCDRLTHTWGALSPQANLLSEKFKKLFSAKSNWKNIKYAIRCASRPFFPCIAIFMRDLKQLEDLPMIQDGGIHYYRCIAQYTLISMLLEGGKSRVDNIIPNADIQGVFSFWKLVDNKALMDMSILSQE
eukprot:Tbor_TRINITY_DN2838_c0_g1::TRINITY_DN2838_c0_g1_i1::g.23142::m.23142/K03099/SOS; son of sevenless